ncbi:MAG: V-type ATPase subunit [Eubacteriales bacterium]|nr:V-type ATPase subunit [Eubacteriales bacterium]
MSRDQYIYAVARIRTRELSLLNGAVMEQLAAAPSEEDCLRLLQAKGWGGRGQGAQEILEEEEEKTWALLEELAGGLSLFAVFLRENDYHNVKAAVKEACTGGEHPGIYKKRATISGEEIERALTKREPETLPEPFRATAEYAMRVLLQTRDGQRCDAIVDRASLIAIRQEGAQSGSSLLREYGERTAALCNVKIAMRCALTGQSLSFIEESLAPCGAFEEKSMAKAAAAGSEALFAYLRENGMEEAAETLRISYTEFERWCDNELIRMIRPQLTNCFGPDPLAAYLLARQMEIKSVRMILAGKRNALPETAIRQRVRETYV